MHHDKFAVVAFNRAILQAASSKGIACHKLHIFSDGAGGQFKNRFTLSNIIRPEVIGQAVKEVDWSFFATAHGKGPVDGVGGTVKRAVWRRILQKRVLLNNPKEFYDVAREACPNVHVLFVGAEDVATIRKELDNLWTKDNPKNIPQIRSLHYFRYASPTELESAVVSPFLPGIQPDMNKVVLFHSNQTPQHVLHSKVKIIAENYYAVDYADRYYIGLVLHAEEKHGYWKMKFLHQMSQDGIITFTWPRQDDCDDVHESLIFFGPIMLDGCVQFTISNLRDIHACFANLVEK